MNESLRHVVVGTAGHIDHGKSTLVRALTGIDPDRLPEERERGITIDLGFAPAEIGDCVVSFVDVPGHERFVHNMLAGATGIDLVLLVVAADESVMPQTREHLAICRLLGIPAGLVAITRTDLVEPGMVELVAADVDELARGTFLEGAPVVAVSGVTGEGLDALRQALISVASSLPPRLVGPWPRLPVDRVFAARGFGTVVTGTLQGGSLAVGDALEAIPNGPAGRIRGLQVHGATVEVAGPQRRVAVNLQGVDRERLARGMVLVPPGLGATTLVFDARIEVTADAAGPLEDEQRVRVHHGTAEVLGRLRLPGERPVPPGAAGAAQIRLESPLAALPGDRFIVRRYSPVTTLGGGVIVDLDPPRWKRDDPRWPTRAEALAAASPTERLAILVHDAGSEGVDLAERAVRIGMTLASARSAAAELEEAPRPAERLVVLGGGRVISVPAREELFDAVAGELARHHAEHPLEEGLAPERLRSVLTPRWAPEEFRALLARLEGRGRIVARPDAVRLASHAAVPQADQAERLAAVERAFFAAGFETVQEAELLETLGGGAAARSLLAFASRQGGAIKVKEGLWVGGDAWRRLIERLRRESAAGRALIDVPSFKELFGLSRKHAIPLLEKLDAEGVTQRIGNERRVRPPR